MKSLLIKTAILIIISIFLFLVATDILLWWILQSPDASHPSTNTGKFAPTKNNHSNYFLTIQGKVEAKLKGKQHLKWVMIYQTTNQACEYDASGGTEGIYTPRMITIEYSIQTGKQNHYRNKIPLDYYQEGYCGWMLSNAILVNGKKSFSELDHLINIIFQAKSDVLKSINYNFACDDKHCNDQQNQRLAIIKKASRSQQLKLQINFYYRSNKRDHHS